MLLARPVGRCNGKGAGAVAGGLPLEGGVELASASLMLPDGVEGAGRYSWIRLRTLGYVLPSFGRGPRRTNAVMSDRELESDGMVPSDEDTGTGDATAADDSGTFAVTFGVVGPTSREKICVGAPCCRGCDCGCDCASAGVLMAAL